MLKIKCGNRMLHDPTLESGNDARAILRASAGLEKLDGQAAKNADMNDDGKITAEDARSALRKSAGLETGS